MKVIKFAAMLMMICHVSYGITSQLRMNMDDNFSQLIDHDYVLKAHTLGTMDKEKISLYRYAPKQQTKVILGAEHTSLVINEDQRLKGLTRMTHTLFAQEQDLPTKDEARRIAITFLESYAPDLVNDMSIKWIDTHTEEVSTPQGEMTLLGMKVKCRKSSDGLYFWVVVAADRSIMTFERDIKWDFLRAGRKTEKWLHDTWLKEQNFVL